MPRASMAYSSSVIVYSAARLFRDTRLGLFRRPTVDRPSVLIKPGIVGSHLGWGTIAMSGDEPGFVVAPGELDERGSQLFDGVECSHHVGFPSRFG